MSARILDNPHRAARATVRRPSPTRFHRTLDGYEPTRLVDAGACARALGVARVWAKDESRRLGLPAFKVLGASWATHRALCSRTGLDPEAATLDELASRLATGGSDLGLITATDGNHGRAVARVARRLGIGAHVLVPAGTAAARIAAIEGEGARVTVVDGSYDDAVAASARLADGERRLLVSDTSWPGYEEIPAWIAEGYATIGAEVDEALAAAGTPAPDVVAVQIGVGALAAAVIAHFGAPGVLLVGVEPTRAACVLASLEAGQPVALPGVQDSVMAGLNCGTPSLVAWPAMRDGLDVAVAVDDARVPEAQELLAADGIEAGETGAAGLAGLLELRDHGRLASGATALVLVTEGPTGGER